MTASERVIRTQRLLGAAAIAQSLAWGLACALAILAAISFISLLKPGFDKNTEANVAISLMAGVIVVAGLLWRSRHFSSTPCCGAASSISVRSWSHVRYRLLTHGVQATRPVQCPPFASVSSVVGLLY